MYSRSYGVRNTWLNNYLQRRISEEPSRGNMVNGLKHSFNLKDSTFTIFIDYSEGN